MGGRFHVCFNRAGFVYVAFVIDVFARYIVGWKVSLRPHRLVAGTRWSRLCTRQPFHQGGLIHQGDRGVQYVSIRYAERPDRRRGRTLGGQRGDSYDNALARKPSMGCLVG